MKNNSSEILKPNKYLIGGLILGILLTVFLVGGIFIGAKYFSDQQGETVSSGEDPTPKNSPLVNLPKLRSVPPSEITAVAFSESVHYGPLVGSDESYTTSSTTSFSNDGNAFKSSGGKNYDTGKQENSESERFQGSISKEQFKILAQTLSDNDFLNLSDSTETISDTTSYSLTVTYSGKTKTILTSNTGKDTAEIGKILQAFESVENEIGWKKSN